MLGSLKPGDELFASRDGEVLCIKIQVVNNSGWITCFCETHGTQIHLHRHEPNGENWFVSPEAALSANLDRLDSYIEQQQLQLRELRKTRKWVFEKLYPEGFP